MRFAPPERKAQSDVQANHTKPAVAVLLTFPGDPAAAGAGADARLAAVAAVVAAGVPVIESAGFAGEDDVISDAAACATAAGVAGVLTVSATQEDDSLAEGVAAGRPFRARRGGCVDIVAPGQGVLAPAQSPARAQVVRATSPVAAAGLVAGVVALYIDAFPAARPAEVRPSLCARGTCFCPAATQCCVWAVVCAL